MRPVSTPPVDSPSVPEEKRERVRARKMVDETARRSPASSRPSGSFPVGPVASPDAISEPLDLEGNETPDDGAAERQRALRDAVIEFRRALARVAEEDDRLIHHIGLRTLSGQTEANGLNPDHLEEPEDQHFVHLLLNTLRKDVSRSFERLNRDERADLHVLDDCANAEQAHKDAKARQQQAEQHALSLREQAQKHRLEFSTAMSRDGRALAALASARPRSRLIRGLGLLLAGCSLMAVASVAGQFHSQGAGVLLVSGLVGLSLLFIGVRLSQNPLVVKERLQHKLTALGDAARLSAEKLATAEVDLVQAVERAKQAEANFQREEVVAVEILQRRPGILRYVLQSLATSKDTPTAAEAPPADPLQSAVLVVNPSPQTTWPRPPPEEPVTETQTRQ